MDGTGCGGSMRWFTLDTNDLITYTVDVVLDDQLRKLREAAAKFDSPRYQNRAPRTPKPGFRKGRNK